jgi:hypothetical protein
MDQKIQEVIVLSQGLETIWRQASQAGGSMEYFYTALGSMMGYDLIGNIMPKMPDVASAKQFLEQQIKLWQGAVTTTAATQPYWYFAYAQMAAYQMMLMRLTM